MLSAFWNLLIFSHQISIVMFHTQGIVLKKNHYREYDEVFIVYTKDFGKIEILGRGVKRPAAKLPSHLQVLDLSNIEFVLGKKFRVLTGADLIGNIVPPDNCPAARKCICDFFSFLDDLIGFEDADNDIWNLILEVADFSIKSESDEIRPIGYFLFSNFFKFKLLSIAGFSLNLENCSSCNSKFKEEDHFFSAKEGGVVCGGCDLKNKPYAFTVLASTIKILRIFQNRDVELLKKIKLSEKEKDDLNKVFDRFSGWILGK